ncbi:hypothetical protein CDL12_24203 [Handroanthus impetiginosus]|uniref:Uncharacterized protein n=1 Tax=Handroanthus impetiginosus TaxID=429701 RepID=A0A2G9GDC2_9LAMI|nr:hypothetical protein CDL12_24203 [Handroanthus impetiginosus]
MLFDPPPPAYSPLRISTSEFHVLERSSIRLHRDVLLSRFPHRSSTFWSNFNHPRTVCPASCHTVGVWSFPVVPADEGGGQINFLKFQGGCSSILLHRRYHQFRNGNSKQEGFYPLW